MSPQQLSSEAHRQLPHANPLSVEQMGDLVELALERKPRTVLEIGCGAGEFSIALARRQNVHVIALDTNPYSLERAAAAAKGLIGNIEFRQCAAADFTGAPADLVVCIGASQAFGTPCQSLQILRSLLRAGGTLVFAELSWSGKPSPDYLQYLGISEDDYWATEESEAVFSEAGLQIEHKLVASLESWARYEAGVVHGRLEFAKTLPTDQAAQVTATSTEWFRAYEEHGRHCLGFAAVVATISDG